MLTPISASSFTDSRIVTWWFGFATLVDIPADNPARPAPMIIRWIDIVISSLLSRLMKLESRSNDRALLNL